MEDIEAVVEALRGRVSVAVKIGSLVRCRSGDGVRDVGIAQQHEHVPDPQLRGEGDAIVEQCQIPARAIRGGRDAQLLQFPPHLTVPCIRSAQPTLLEFLQRAHQSCEPCSVQLLQPSQLPHPHEHHEGHFLVVVAEQRGGYGGHALHVSCVREV